MGNALENAIRSAKAFRIAHPDSQAAITLAAEEAQNLLCVQMENPCDRVIYESGTKMESIDGFLPANAFATTSGKGHGNGLARMDTIVKKYDGTAGFRFDDEAKKFITRLTLIIP